MTCVHEHCRQPVRVCSQAPVGHNCLGWVHARTGLHGCDSFNGTHAEPDPAREEQR